MTKPRSPLSIDAGLTHVADTLPGGWREMAELTRRREHYLRDCADPERKQQLQLADALLLDTACHQAGGGTPLFEFYAGRLTALGVAPCAGRASMHDLIVAIVREGAEAGAAGVIAARPDASFADQRTFLREVEEALVALERVRTVQAAIVSAAAPAPSNVEVLSAAAAGRMTTGPP